MVKGKLLPRMVQVGVRSEEHTSELQSQSNLVCRLLLEKKTIVHMTLSSQLQNRRVAFTAQSDDKNPAAELQAAVVISDTPSYHATLPPRQFHLTKIAAH